MTSSPHECGSCRHLNTGRCGTQENAGRNWCEQLNEWRSLIGPVECPFWELKACGACVVFNACAPYPDAGSCSIHGAVTRSQPAAGCRHFFSKMQLNAPLYGRTPRA